MMLNKEYNQTIPYYEITFLLHLNFARLLLKADLTVAHEHIKNNKIRNNKEVC